jgi:hypothetical protein
MEPRIGGIVEQHEANDRGGAVFGDLAGFVEEISAAGATPVVLAPGDTLSV